MTQKKFEYIESKSDVHFYHDSKGKMYQQLGVGPIYPVKNGKITYRFIANVYGLDIKYQNNGVNGFSIFKGKKLMEDNIWLYSDASRIATELYRQIS